MIGVLPFTFNLTIFINLFDFNIYFDQASDSKSSTALIINNTNFSGQRVINFRSAEIEAAATAGYVGENDFFLEFIMTGTDGASILLPIEIWTEPVPEETQ